MELIKKKEMIYLGLGWLAVVVGFVAGWACLYSVEMVETQATSLPDQRVMHESCEFKYSTVTCWGVVIPFSYQVNQNQYDGKISKRFSDQELANNFYDHFNVSRELTIYYLRRDPENYSWRKIPTVDNMGIHPLGSIIMVISSVVFVSVMYLTILMIWGCRNEIRLRKLSLPA